MIDRIHLKASLIKAAIVLIPSYSAAYLTDKMVYVVPTLAAAGFFAASLNLEHDRTSRNVDDDGDESDEADHFDEGE